MPRLYKVDSAKRSSLVEELRAEVMREPEVVFAYGYGSFLESEAFHDVDVGVCLVTDEPEKATVKALALAQRLRARVGFPVDVRILNQAPASFVFHVLRGPPDRVSRINLTLRGALIRSQASSASS